MKNQKENNYQLPENWYESLRKKYEQMTALQLKKSKILMVKDLEEINLLLDQVIVAENKNQPKSIQDIQREINKNRKIQRSLLKSLENFQFMLTGDYSVKADQEIQRIGKEIKVLREEISKFSRMLSVPMQKDIEMCQQLQKQLFEIQKNVEQAKVKNLKKKQRIQQINSKIQGKINGIKVISKQIEKKAEDSEYEQATITSEQHLQKYQQLVLKRNKLTHFFDKDEKRFKRQYELKIQKFRDIQQAAKQIQTYLAQIQKSVQQRLQQLKKIKQKRQNIVKRHRNSDGIGLTQRKIKTEQNSQVQGFAKIVVSKRSSRLISQAGDMMPKPNFDNRHNYSQIGSSQNLLPKLYKALGKSKLDIEQDCDVKDLLYL